MPKDSASQDIFRLLGLKTAQVELFWEVYQKGELSVDGTMSAFMFSRFFDVEYTPFVDRVCGLLLTPGQTFMDFKIFVATVWNYATLTDEGIRRFAFTTYDLDGGGTLDVDEIKCLFAEICGNDFAASDKATVLIQRIDDMAKFQSVDGQVTSFIFSEFAKRNDAVLLQAFHLQSQIKEKLGDVDMWYDLTMQRQEDQAGAADGGWSTLHEAITQILKRKESSDFHVVQDNTPKGLSKEKLEIMRKREEFLKRQQGASNSLTMLQAKPGEEHQYVTKFTDWRRTAQDLHEQTDFFLRDRVRIAAVPDNFLENKTLRNPQRDVSKIEDHHKHLEILNFGRELHHDTQLAAEKFEDFSLGEAEARLTRIMVHPDHPVSFNERITLK